MQSLSSTISHFSHPHPLHLTAVADLAHSGLLPCPACKTPVSGYAYRCSRGCSFFIHSWCAALAIAITHPGHSHHHHHHLTLLAAPGHSHGSFTCDGCGRSGDGFNYRCTAPGCDFDLHAVCAARPLEAAHPSHSHPLRLAFFPPYKNRAFLCNICRKAGSDHWLYRCGSCNFDAHLGCVGSGHGSGHHHHHFNYSQSLPTNNNNYAVLLPQVNGQLGRVNSYQPAPTAPFWGSLMMAGAEGVVEGVAQQGAQEVVHHMAGGGGDGGDAAVDLSSGLFDLFYFL